MNIEKENKPILIRRGYEKTSGQLCDLWVVYLDKDAFWRIDSVTSNDCVIVVKPSYSAWMTGADYANSAMQHNTDFLAKPYLNFKERRYLSSIIKPFRNRVEGITKKDCFADEYIEILITNDLSIQLPSFDEGTMYKGLKKDLTYTLEEIGL